MVINFMKQYLDLLNHIIDNGVEKSDRTGVGTLSTFGYQTKFDLSKLSINYNKENSY